MDTDRRWHDGGVTRTNEFGQPIGEPVEFAGARPVEPVTLTGGTCSLEPLERRHADELMTALRAVAGDEHWTYLPYPPVHDLAGCEALVDTLRAVPDAVPFAILDRDGVVQGTASLMRVQPSVGSAEVGSIIYGAGVRRAAAATEAMYLFARHVFELGYRRYEWKCDALNAPSRAAALRLGFTFEGVWRHAMTYKGRNRDTAWYAMTDADWARLAPGYEAWLRDLDDAGTQAGPLAAYLGTTSA